MPHSTTNSEACHGLPWLATSTSQKLEDLWFWLQFRAKPGELLVPLRLLDKGPHPEREQCRHAVNGILNVTAGMPASLKQAHKVIHTHTHKKKNINQKWKNMRISEKPLPGSWWWTKDRHLPESLACRQWGLDGPKQEKIPTLRLLLRIQHQNLRNPPTTLSEGWPQHSTLDNPRNIMHKQVALALLQYVTIHCKNKINRWIHVGSFKKLLSIEPPSRNVRPLVVPRVDQAHPNR